MFFSLRLMEFKTTYRSSNMSLVSEGPISYQEKNQEKLTVEYMNRKHPSRTPTQGHLSRKALQLILLVVYIYLVLKKISSGNFLLKFVFNLVLLDVFQLLGINQL